MPAVAACGLGHRYRAIIVDVWTLGSLRQVLADGRAEPARDCRREALPYLRQRRRSAGGSPVRARARADWNRVPEQRLFLRAPLAFEVVGTRANGRAPEVESPEALSA